MHGGVTGKASDGLPMSIICLWLCSIRFGTYLASKVKHFFDYYQLCFSEPWAQ